MNIEYTENGILTADSEIVLGRAIQRGLKAKERLKQGVEEHELPDIELAIQEYNKAFNIFVEHNLGLVYMVAKRYFGNGTSVTEDDIIQDGKLGLVNAINKFDPDRGNKFSTHATHWIRQSISRSLNTVVRTIRLPESRSKVISVMKRLKATNEKLTDSEIDDLVMKELGLSPETLSSIRNATSPHVSLSTPVKTENSDNGRDLSDIISNTRHDECLDVELEVIEREMKQEVVSIVSELNPLEGIVLSSYFEIPLSDEPLLTPQQVCEKYSLRSQEYSNKKNSALKKTRNIMNQRGLSLESFLYN